MRPPRSPRTLRRDIRLAVERCWRPSPLLPEDGFQVSEDLKCARHSAASTSAPWRCALHGFPEHAENIRGHRERLMEAEIYLGASGSRARPR